MIFKPDLRGWGSGNTATRGVWRFSAGSPGPSVGISSIIHGNEIVGAVVLSEMLAHGIQLLSGSLTLAFCNLDAFDRFRPERPLESRYVEEDMNRVWSVSCLGAAASSEARRAAELEPWLCSVDRLIDLHTMHEEGPPVLLALDQGQNERFGVSLGFPQVVVSDPGHGSGRRLIDHPNFGQAHTDRLAVLLEAGGHQDAQSLKVCRSIVARALIGLGMVESGTLPPGFDTPRQGLPQVLLRVRGRATAVNSSAHFFQPLSNLQVIKSAGTVIGTDGEQPIVSPFDECVLLMPKAVDVSAGETLVRFCEKEN